jgi:hypothetical protein
MRVNDYGLVHAGMWQDTLRGACGGGSVVCILLHILSLARCVAFLVVAWRDCTRTQPKLPANPHPPSVHPQSIFLVYHPGVVSWLVG